MQNILNINAYIQIYNTHIYTYIQKMELLEVAAAAETGNLTQQLSTATERVDALQKETLALKVSLFISACHTFFIYAQSYIHTFTLVQSEIAAALKANSDLESSKLALSKVCCIYSLLHIKVYICMCCVNVSVYVQCIEYQSIKSFI